VRGSTAPTSSHLVVLKAADRGHAFHAEVTSGAWLRGQAQPFFKGGLECFPTCLEIVWATDPCYERLGLPEGDLARGAIPIRQGHLGPDPHPGRLGIRGHPLAPDLRGGGAAHRDAGGPPEPPEPGHDVVAQLSVDAEAIAKLHTYTPVTADLHVWAAGGRPCVDDSEVAVAREVAWRIRTLSANIQTSLGPHATNAGPAVVNPTVSRGTTTAGWYRNREFVGTATQFHYGGWIALPAAPGRSRDNARSRSYGVQPG
jgi:hypothetical protein